MQLVDLTNRLPKGGMTAEEKAAALETIDELRKQIEADEIDGVAWCATGGDYVHHGFAGVGNDFYRLIGAMDALGHYLTYVYHTAELADE